MAKFSPPPYRIPIGFFQMPGQREPMQVYPEKAFWDYLAVYVFERIGGTNGLSVDELTVLIEAARTDAQTSALRREPAYRPPEQYEPRDNSGELKALQDKVSMLESQLSSTRSGMQGLTIQFEALRAEVRRIPDMTALTRRVSDLEGM